MIDIETYKALSDKNRLRILNLLSRSRLCVCELEEILAMSQSNVSRHLNKLKYAQMVESNKEAQWVYYDINKGFIQENKNLYRHLREKFNLHKIFIKDAKKLDLLKKQGSICNRVKQS